MNDVIALDQRAPITREKVMRAEALMQKLGTPVEIPVTHHFANKGTERGAYAREIFIPKGTMLTGHIHKYEQINVLAKGEISVLTDGGEMKRVQAPFVVVSPPGTKRIAYTHEDCVWITFHATRESDLKLVEAECIAHTEQEFLEHVRALEQKEVACLG